MMGVYVLAEKKGRVVKVEIGALMKLSGVT